MNARTLLNVALLALVLALAWFTLRPMPDHADDSAVAVTDLPAANVQRIGIERHGHPAVLLERIDARWQLTAPLALPADEFRVQTLLGLLDARSHSGFRAAGNDLAQFGLEPPLALLRFDEATLAFGNTESLSARRYVLSADQVHLIDDRWFSQVFGAPEAWADPRPLPAHAKVVRIVLPDAEWRLHEGRWQRAPAQPSLSADAGQILADAWQSARALQVRAHDPDLPWDGQVVVRLADAAQDIVFELARITDALMLGRPDLRLQYRFLARQGNELLGQ